MGNCSNCDCNFPEKNIEFDDNVNISTRSNSLQKVEIKKHPRDLLLSEPSRTKLVKKPDSISFKKEKLTIEMNKGHLKKMILIQALIRGFLGRARVRRLKASLQNKKRYFLDEEFWETVSKTLQYDQYSKLLTRREHNYKCSASKYEGEWKGGFRHGKGTMTWDDGASYTGNWVMGRAQGKGKFMHAKGEIYEGDWVHDKAHGQGVYTHSNQAQYVGKWHLDLQHGQGKEKWPDGSVFEGEYAQGKKSGKGFYQWADGASYQGDWLDN